jgi:hypothetical protein
MFRGLGDMCESANSRSLRALWRWSWLHPYRLPGRRPAARVRGRDDERARERVDASGGERRVQQSGRRQPVTAIDTGTLKARTLDIGAGYRASVGSLVITGGRLWFEVDRTGDPYQWYIGSLDLQSRRADVTYTAVPYNPADLATSVGAPSTLVGTGN